MNVKLRRIDCKGVRKPQWKFTSIKILSTFRALLYFLFFPHVFSVFLSEEGGTPCYRCYVLLWIESRSGKLGKMFGKALGNGQLVRISSTRALFIFPRKLYERESRLLWSDFVFFSPFFRYGRKTIERGWIQSAISVLFHWRVRAHRVLSDWNKTHLIQISVSS